MGHEVAVGTLTLALLAGGLALAPQKPPDVAQAQAKTELPALPPRAPVAGLATLETSSTLVFVDKPEARHKLVSTYAFPGRARMHLSLGDERTGQREMRFQYGAKVFTWGTADRQSREPSAAEQQEILRDFELRRAVYLWPDGVDWKRAEGLATAQLADGLGTLRARLDAASVRPSSIDVLDAQGRPLVALQAITWGEEHGRAVPRSFEGWRAGQLSWRETIDARQENKTLLDSFFVPPDLRDPSAERDRLGLVHSEDLPAFASKRVELASGLSWEQALARIEELERACGAELASSGMALETNRTVEVTEKLEPKALHLRLLKVPEKLPAGFALVPARAGRVVFLEGLSAATPERLEALRAALPKEAKAQAPYLRIARQGGRVLMVLPIAPAG